MKELWHRVLAQFVGVTGGWGCVVPLAPYFHFVCMGIVGVGPMHFDRAHTAVECAHAPHALCRWGKAVDADTLFQLSSAFKEQDYQHGGLSRAIAGEQCFC